MLKEKENTIQKTKLLIVEGNHERDFFCAWFLHSGITDIQVLPIGGKTRLKGALPPLVKQDFFTTSVVSLVIVRDADDDPTAAFQSVCSDLSAVADPMTLPIPPMVEQFVTQNELKVAVIITPCNGRCGALEELLMETAAADPLSAAATTYIDEAVALLNETHTRPAPPIHKHGKAKIHAFLATFEEPDKDPGKAALAGAWDFDHPALAPIRTILEQM